MSKDTHADVVFEYGIDFRSRTIYVDRDIEPLEVASMIRGVHMMERLSTDPIKIVVNSPGGDVYTGLALYDALRASKCRIQAYGTGLVASMASVIFLAGQDRVLTPNAKYMVHPCSAWIDGDVNDIKIEHAEVKDLEARIAQIFGERTKRKPGYWKKIVKTRYFSSEECLELGVCTEIIEFPEER